MLGLNVTQCGKRDYKCLGETDCCYECDYRQWCDERCQDKDCRLLTLVRRLGIIKEMKKAPR